ncbi:MAG: large subunit ribosomal protein [Methanolobus sp.]|jgi:large subunit ribosomal protein L6|uniref:Large ribosomal subunit protein uL6 n=1 Tax=Methanolobus tindarius DSM 2278 TaxID=1090322 RepID=W9DY97_METTI|nr:50S ribosomal protein L6 [Methanolobus tindarius]ETA68672.1 LSU ribosomal protein L6P [Methanolobus tindarius DSM 2278]MDK2939599.1 large subunit ribosomal protein [Methanolobus sp.]
MAKEIKKTIEIPEGVTVTMQGKLLSVTGPKGKIERDFWYPGIKIEVAGSEIIVDSTVLKKTQKAMVGTFASHITNMMKGVTEGFEYRMKVVYSHFPMQLKVEGDKLMIGNFLGEKKARSAKILGDTKVKASGDEVIVTGYNKEDVGQTAANIEQTTRIKRFDPRVFQDGIYTVEKIV